MELTINVICEDLPGIEFHDTAGGRSVTYENVHLGIQQGEEVIEAAPADRPKITFAPGFRVAPLADGKTNFLGPFAKGKPQERFFYLAWVTKGADGSLRMFRRAKIHLSHLAWSAVEEALRANKPLSVTLSMTGKRGDPRCGSIRGNQAQWQTSQG